MTVISDQLISGDVWEDNDYETLAFNFRTATFAGLYIRSDFDALFDLSDFGQAFSAGQEDVTRFLLLDAGVVSSYNTTGSPSNTIAAALVNSVAYRASFSDVILTQIDEDSGGVIQLVNHYGETTTSDSLAYFPDDSSTNPVAGEVIINERLASWAALNPGEGGYWNILHELGHAVGGLKDLTATLLHNTAYDSNRYTVMSMNSVGGVWASGLQLLDIAALQDAYQQRDYSTRSGATTYSLGQGLGFNGATANTAF